MDTLDTFAEWNSISSAFGEILASLPWLAQVISIVLCWFSSSAGLLGVCCQPRGWPTMMCCPQAFKTTAPFCKGKLWLQQLAVGTWVLAVAALAAVVMVVVGKVRLLPVSMAVFCHAACYPVASHGTECHPGRFCNSALHVYYSKAALFLCRYPRH